MQLSTKKFMTYASTSVAGMLVSSLYIVVDGIFVGRGIGPSALAAVNLAFPFILLVSATAMMITMGGATLMGINYGKKQYGAGNDIFLQSMFLILILAVPTMIVGVIFSEPLARLMGANAELLQLTADYLRYFLLFDLFYAYSMSICTFVRNDGNPQLAFFAMVLGAITNVLLDYVFIFIFDWGIIGAAVASGLGQVLSCLLLAIHFIRKKGHLRFYRCPLKKQTLTEIIRTGTPEFIVQLNGPINLFTYNIMLMNYVGSLAVSAFSILGYIVTLSIGIFTGISQGIQPLVSQYHGAKEKKSLQNILKLGWLTNFSLALLIYVVLLFFGSEVAKIFNPDPELIAITVKNMKIYCLAFVFTSINVVAITFFLATKNTTKANVISFSRSIVFNILYILILPPLLGEFGIWITLVFAELSTTGIVFICFMQGRSPKNLSHSTR